MVRRQSSALSQQVRPYQHMRQPHPLFLVQMRQAASLRLCQRQQSFFKLGQNRGRLSSGRCRQRRVPQRQRSKGLLQSLLPAAELRWKQQGQGLGRAVKRGQGLQWRLDKQPGQLRLRHHLCLIPLQWWLLLASRQAMAPCPHLLLVVSSQTLLRLQPALLQLPHLLLLVSSHSLLVLLVAQAHLPHPLLW